MIISFSRRYIFFKNMKVGGTSLQEWLAANYADPAVDIVVGNYAQHDGTEAEHAPANNSQYETAEATKQFLQKFPSFGDQHVKYDELRVAFPDECEEFTKISTVRNPWEATWSFVTYMLMRAKARGCRRQKDQLQDMLEWRDYLFSKIDSGEKLDWPTLKHSAFLAGGRRGPMAAWQDPFVWDPETGERCFEHTFRMEDLPGRLVEIPFVDPDKIHPYPRLRSQGKAKPKAKDALNQECLDKIAKINERLIEEFHYTI